MIETLQTSSKSSSFISNPTVKAVILFSLGVGFGAFLANMTRTEPNSQPVILGTNGRSARSFLAKRDLGQNATQVTTPQPQPEQPVTQPQPEQPVTQPQPEQPVTQPQPEQVTQPQPEQPAPKPTEQTPPTGPLVPMNGGGPCLGKLCSKLKLVFEDTFKDLSNWYHSRAEGNELGWDGETKKTLVFTQKTTSLIQNGNENVVCVGGYTNGHQRLGSRLRSRQVFQYGYYEAIVRVKGSKCFHESFWLFPENFEVSETCAKAGPDNYVPGGMEIDVFEHRVADKENNDIDRFAETNIHYNGYNRSCKSSAGSKAWRSKFNLGEWNTYGLLYTREGISSWFNGKKMWQTKLWSEKKMYMILSVEPNAQDSWSGFPCPAESSPEDPDAWIEAKTVRFYEFLNTTQPA